MPAEPAKRGRPPSFDLQTLLDATITVIDGRGLDQCTLRTVAVELGVTAMALYRYASSKDELLSLVPDHLLERHRQPLPKGDGIAALSHVATNLVAVLEAHPAASPLFMRPTMGPTMTTVANECVERLVVDGYSPTRAAGLLRATVAFTIGLNATGGSSADSNLGPVADDALQLWFTGLRHTPTS